MLREQSASESHPSVAANRELLIFISKSYSIVWMVTDSQGSSSPNLP